jgi:hypothetical protein
VQFSITDASGALANADSTPTMTIYRNGTSDGANWSLGGVTNPATGIYRNTGTVYASASAGDLIEVFIAATVGGVATGGFVERFRLVQWPVTAFPNAASGASGAVLTDGTGTAQLSSTSGRVVANVTHFGGTAGTFNAGIPDVRWASGVTQGSSTTLVRCGSSSSTPAIYATSSATDTPAVYFYASGAGASPGFKLESVNHNALFGKCAGSNACVYLEADGTGSVLVLDGFENGSNTAPVVQIYTNSNQDGIKVSGSAAGTGKDINLAGSQSIAGYLTGVASPTFAGDGVQAALSATERAAIAEAILALANGVETGFTLRRALRIIAAGVAGKSSGGPGSPVFRNLGDTADQITGTADTDGDRSAATYGA